MALSRSLSAMILFTALACLITVPASGGSQSRRAVAVPDFKARGLEETIVQSITEVVIKEVDRLGLFRMISMDDIRQMLEHEQSKMMLGCDDTSCLAEIGEALGVELLLAGSVGKVGDTYVVSLKLIDVRKVEVISREERTVSGKIEELLDVSRLAAKVSDPLFFVLWHRARCVGDERVDLCVTRAYHN